MIKAVWLKDDLTDAHYIRREVFINEQNVAEADEMDGTDAGASSADGEKRAVHLVVYSDGAPVATGRFLRGEDSITIGRVAVLKQYRGQGLGDLVVRMLIREGYESGYEKQLIHSQTHAKGFYEKLGFTQTGEEFEEAGIPHVTMTRTGDVICGCCTR